MATRSSTLAWKIPWTEEPGRLQSMGSLRVGHDRVTSLSLFSFMHWRRKWQATPLFLPGESQEWGSLVGCHLWVHAKLDMTEATQQQQQQQGHNSCGGGSPFPCKLGTARIPVSHAAVPFSCLPLTGAELPQAKKVLYICMQSHFGRVQFFETLQTVTCQASLSEKGFSRQEYWSVLASTRCHTFLEHCISCFPSFQLP